MQIIVTTRPDYATELELSNAFGQYDKIYISPFNRDQKINFITKTLEFFNQNKEQSYNYTFLERTEDYIQVLDENNSLDRLSRSPQLIYQIILTMPWLKKELLENNNHIFTKFEINQIFINQYINTKI